MPYMKDLHANLGYVDKQYKDYLDELCKHHKRTIKDELEYLIEQAWDKDALWKIKQKSS